MRQKPSNQIVRRKLLTWFSQHRRDLPWRRTTDPYAILISEVMLQQTQVDRVMPKYRAWLKTFPTIQSLARAPLIKVLKLWSGLGYNSRGKRLRDAARVVIRERNGKIPSDVAALESLPGIGPYTARAVASFAFRKNVAVIDTNVRRVISRIFFGVRDPKNQKQLQTAVNAVAPKYNLHDWNAALMDFGALVCQSRKPKCDVCPVQQYCRAYPAVLQPVKQTNKQGSNRFEETDRFWRGRIISTLVNNGSQSLVVLKKHLDQLGHLTNQRFQRLVRALDQENIVRRSGRKLAIQA